MLIESSNVFIPPELLAQIVYDCGDCNVVGVPEIYPVSESIEIPSGNSGYASQEVMTPQVLNDSSGVIETPTVNVKALEL